MVLKQKLPISSQLVIWGLAQFGHHNLKARSKEYVFFCVCQLIIWCEAYSEGQTYRIHALLPIREHPEKVLPMQELWGVQEKNWALTETVELGVFVP